MIRGFQSALCCGEERQLSGPERNRRVGVLSRTFRLGKTSAHRQGNALSVWRLWHAQLVCGSRPHAAEGLGSGQREAAEWNFGRNSCGGNDQFAIQPSANELNRRPRSRQGTRVSLIRLSARGDALFSHVRNREEISDDVEISRCHRLSRACLPDCARILHLSLRDLSQLLRNVQVGAL